MDRTPFRLIGVALIAISASAEASAPSYRYQDKDIRLRINTATVSETTIVAQVVDSKGRVRGRKIKKKAKLVAGENLIPIEVGLDSGHVVRFSSGKQRWNLRTNRGTWYAIPESTTVERSPMTRSSQLAISSDLILAGGMRATMQRSDGKSHLLIGRNLGLEKDVGIVVKKSQALLLVVKSNVGAAVITLAQRINAKKMRYWDYAVNVGEAYQRMVIPLSAFHRRDGGGGRITSIRTVSLRAVHPTNQGGYLDVDHLALTGRAPHVAWVVRKKKQVHLSVADIGKPVKVMVAKEGDEPVVHETKRRRSKFVDDGHRLWICYQDTGVEVCDPPDAPLTSYTVPPVKGVIVVDDFRGEAPVNSLRLPTQVFTSSAGVDPFLYGTRKDGSLTLNKPATSAIEYIGYRTSFPTKLMKRVTGLQLRLRGSATEVLIGVRGKRGDEPKVSLFAYLPELTSTWQEVRIPLQAFRTIQAVPSWKRKKWRDAITSVTVTLTKGGEEQSTVEIAQIALLSERPPLVTQSFDVEPAGQTAVGGKLTFIAKKGAKIEQVESARAGGRAGGARVSGIGGKALARAAVGLPEVDVSGYEKLLLWVKTDAAGAEKLVVYLGDGRRISPVEAELSLTTDWQQAVIPLALFDRRIKRSKLTEVGIAWENRTIPQQTIFFDDVRFE